MKYMTDGGIWAVNPTMASLALLKSPASNLGAVSWADIKILNIGTGDFHNPPMDIGPNEDIGYVKLAQLIPDVFLDGVNRMIATQAGWICMMIFIGYRLNYQKRLVWMIGKRGISF